MMDRLSERVEFRVHAHAFRHTFATVATPAGRTAWRFRCEEPDCPIGVVTYSQEWEPDAGLSVHCPLCSSAMGELDIADVVGSDDGDIDEC
jgi:hypothetical protein